MTARKIIPILFCFIFLFCECNGSYMRLVTNERTRGKDILKLLRISNRENNEEAEAGSGTQQLSIREAETTWGPLHCEKVKICEDEGNCRDLDLGMECIHSVDKEDCDYVCQEQELEGHCCPNNLCCRKYGINTEQVVISVVVALAVLGLFVILFLVVITQMKEKDEKETPNK